MLSEAHWARSFATQVGRRRRRVPCVPPLAHLLLGRRARRHPVTAFAAALAHAAAAAALAAIDAATERGS